MVIQKQRQKPDFPIFRMYTIDQLSKRLGLTKRYLCDLEEGIRPLPRRFKINTCLILRRSHVHLFGDEEPEE